MKFKEILLMAKHDDKNAFEEIIEMYKPLVIKESIVNGTFDEDLYQELWIVLIHCIHKFQI